MKTHHTPETACLDCGKRLNRLSSAHTKKKPRPGDVTICLGCGHIMVYAHDLSLRAPTDAEMVEIAGDKDVLTA